MPACKNARIERKPTDQQRKNAVVTVKSIGKQRKVADCFKSLSARERKLLAMVIQNLEILSSHVLSLSQYCMEASKGCRKIAQSSSKCSKCSKCSKKSRLHT